MAKIILGIETSCDETAAAILEQKQGRIQILSNVVASSAVLQAKFGGIIPEQAAREQLKSMIPVIEEALRQALPKERLPRPSGTRNDRMEIDAIAVTQGPGLIGSLLVGVETAKVLARVWNKPLIPVNHLIGHFYANWIQNQYQVLSSKYYGENKEKHNTKYIIHNTPVFPCIGLLVSGGHTDLVLFTGHGKYEYLGGTRDDAAGECFDKCARLLGLPYPGGPTIAQKAMEFKIQNSKIKIELPRPLIHDKTFDFSFSGLKTAVLREVERLKSIDQFSNLAIRQLAFEVQAAIVEVLVTKTVRAAQLYKVDQIIVAGGVAANQELVRNFKFQISNFKLKAQLFVPHPNLCTDNAAMVASAAFFINPLKNLSDLQANPNLFLSP